MSFKIITVTVEQLPNSAGTEDYVVPANTVAQILQCNVTNEDTTNETFSIHIAAAGAATAVTNLYIDAKPVAAGQTDLCPELVGMWLDTTDDITAFCSTAAKCNMRLSIKEVPQAD